MTPYLNFNKNKYIIFGMCSLRYIHFRSLLSLTRSKDCLWISVLRYFPWSLITDTAAATNNCSEWSILP